MAWHGIPEVVLAVEVPAGLIDGALCLVWLKAIMLGRCVPQEE